MDNDEILKIVKNGFTKPLRPTTDENILSQLRDFVVGTTALPIAKTLGRWPNNPDSGPSNS